MDQVEIPLNYVYRSKEDKALEVSRNKKEDIDKEDKFRDAESWIGEETLMSGLDSGIVDYD